MGVWCDGFGIEGIVLCPFQPGNHQLLGWCPRFAKDDWCGSESRHVSGREDPTLLLSVVVLDHELINEDDDNDDDNNKDCGKSLILWF